MTLRSLPLPVKCGWLTAAVLLAWSLLLAECASAQSNFWVAEGVGNWNVAANWSGGVPTVEIDPQVNNGGTVRLFDPGASARFVRLGNSSGNSGTLEILGGTAEFNIFLVGDGGHGTLLIANGGRLSLVNGNPGEIGSSAGSSGSATVDGLGSKWTITGSFHVGKFGTGTLDITDGGEVISVSPQIGVNVESYGTVTVGSGGSWSNSGDLRVGYLGTGMLNIHNGGAVTSNRSGDVGWLAGSHGTATVNGAGSTWDNANDLSVGYWGTGALNITDGGVVTSTYGYVGRNFGGAGTVLIDSPGSKWNCSGAFIIGTGAGTLTVQNGGVLSTAGEMLIRSLGVLRGDGTIVGNVGNYAGIVAPSASTGTLHITGDYQHNGGSKLQIELASPTSFDKLAVTGTIDLAGVFAGGGDLEVSLSGGYVPRGSQSFDILDWGGLRGEFASIELPTLGGTLVWDTSQLYTTGVLSVVGPDPTFLAADFTENGVVDGADLTRWRTNFGTGAIHLQGNADADGDVDGADFLVWQRQLGAPIVAATAAVPEPVTLLLLVSGVLAAFYRRRGEMS